MRNLYLLIVPIICLLVVSPAHAEGVKVRSLAEGEVSPPAKIDDLAWLVGRWKGEGLGGLAEEVMAPSVDGQMMGMFRLGNADGSLRFYEFYLFAEVNDSLTMRIKHFTPDLHSWETKEEFVEFPLVAIEENAVYFDGLTYKLTGPDELSSAVNVKGQGTLTFWFEREELGVE